MTTKEFYERLVRDCPTGWSAYKFYHDERDGRLHPCLQRTCGKVHVLHRNCTEFGVNEGPLGAGLFPRDLRTFSSVEAAITYWELSNGHQNVLQGAT